MAAMFCSSAGATRGFRCSFCVRRVKCSKRLMFYVCLCITAVSLTVISPHLSSTSSSSVAEASTRHIVTRKNHPLSMATVSDMLLKSISSARTNGWSHRWVANKFLYVTDSDSTTHVVLQRRGALLKLFRKFKQQIDGETAAGTVTVQQLVPFQSVIDGVNSQKSSQAICRNRQTLNIINTSNRTLCAWEQFVNGVGSTDLYSDTDSTTVSELISNMQSLAVAGVIAPPATWNHLQFKVILRLADGSSTIFTPQRSATWYDGDSSPDLFYAFIPNNPVAELAAFHLDRILGFRRAPPASWGSLNISHVEQCLVNEPKSDTQRIELYASPASNLCMYADYRHYCAHEEPICAAGDMFHGTFVAFLPTSPDGIELRTLADPWARPTSPTDSPAYWESNPEEFCEHTRDTAPFNNQSLILSLIDVHIFDFLTGNMARNKLYMYNNSTSFIHMDNAKGFVRSDDDELSILAPLYQCCMARLSTVETLLTLYTSQPTNKLSQRVNRSMQNDPLSPLLTDRQLNALDRRVGLVLQQIETCLQNNFPRKHVIMNC